VSPLLSRRQVLDTGVEGNQNAAMFHRLVCGQQPHGEKPDKPARFSLTPVRRFYSIKATIEYLIQ
jgi:hypothetical protein